MLISCVVYHTVGSLVTLSWLEQGAGRPVVAKTAFFDGFGWVMSLQDASLWAQLLDGSQVVVATTQAVYVAEDGARRVLALDNGIIQVLCHPSLVCVPVLFVATLLLRHLARTKRGARRGGGGGGGGGGGEALFRWKTGARGTSWAEEPCDRAVGVDKLADVEYWRGDRRGPGMCQIML